MYEFRALLDRFWVTRAEDRELYFNLKRTLPDYRRLVNELLGWNLVVNESVVKLEKVPPRAMPWMGIQSVQEPLDYCLLCAVLLYLADLDDGAPFLLSSLTQAVETFLSEVQPVDWTRFPHRKSLVRVLQYAQEVGLVLVYDGNSALFGNDQSQEVLYENTGLSRHFPVHFGRDIMGCRSIEDFEALAWEGDETEQRRRRSCRRRIRPESSSWRQRRRRGPRRFASCRPESRGCARSYGDPAGRHFHGPDGQRRWQRCCGRSRRQNPPGFLNDLWSGCRRRRGSAASFRRIPPRCAGFRP